MSNRLNKIFNKYNEQLVSLTDKPNELFSNIVSCDITKGKYVEFILNCYLNKTIQENDLVGGLESTVGKSISLFHKNKKFLEPENRSLNKYKTVGDLWKTVKNYDKEKSSHEIKKEYREKINKETKFIVDKNFKILSPLTKESAQFWGRNTRWCTSAKENNMFDWYNNQAPLYIVVLPNGNKFQFWNHESRYEAMDEADNLLNKKDIENNWNYFKHIKEVIHILLIPENERTKELCEIAVKNDGFSLEYVPKELKTKELCELAVKKNGYALEYVSKELIDRKIALQAVENTGYALKFIPKEIIDKHIALEAVKNDVLSLEFVPEELKTKELCEIAVKNDSWVFQYVPDKFKTKELCEMAVKKNSFSLKYVPEELITKKMCELAIKRNIRSLKFIPEEQKIKELYKFAVKQNGYAIKYIPKKLIDKDIALEAIRQNTDSIKCIPENINLMDKFDINPETKEITLKDNNKPKNTQNNALEM